MTAIPVAGAPELVRAGRVGRWIHIALFVTAAAAITAFALVSRHPSTRTAIPLPNRADTVVVLDVSASISADTFSRIGTTLDSLARSGRRLGLVVFSDQAYEALPPGTAASDLAPLVRYFTLPKQTTPGFAPTFPANPWAASFSGGTKISAGLSLAHAIALADRAHPSAVVLVSDLDDDPGDLTRLGAVLLAYRRDRVPMRVVPLDPSAPNLALFRRLVPAVAATAPPETHAAAQRSTAFPWLLVALALVFAAAAAAREWWAPRLEWAAT